MVLLKEHEMQIYNNRSYFILRQSDYSGNYLVCRSHHGTPLFLRGSSSTSVSHEN